MPSSNLAWTLSTTGPSLCAHHRAAAVALLRDRELLGAELSTRRVDSLLNSLTVYISRNNKLGYHGDIYLRFIRLTRKLTRAFPGLDQANGDALREEVKEISVQSLREWLEARILKLS